MTRAGHVPYCWCRVDRVTEALFCELEVFMKTLRQKKRNAGNLLVESYIVNPSTSDLRQFYCARCTRVNFFKLQEIVNTILKSIYNVYYFSALI